MGEGALRRQFESLIQDLGVTDDVLMPGYCKKVPTMLANSKVLVMPSLTEGLPITLLEAMALKTPVVASAVGEIPKVLGNGAGGQLLSDVEPTTITSAIAGCFADGVKCGKQVDWAYAVVQDNYSSESMAGQYLKFYNRVLEKQ